MTPEATVCGMSGILTGRGDTPGPSCDNRKQEQRAVPPMLLHSPLAQESPQHAPSWPISGAAPGAKPRARNAAMRPCATGGTWNLPGRSVLLLHSPLAQ